MSMINIKQIIKNVLTLMGYEFARLPKCSAGYENMLIYCNYAPWQLDKDFLITYDIIKDYTLVGKYRCYELWHLVSQSLKLGGALIEIGVWKGGTGGLICKRAKLTGNNNTVYLADTFRGVVKNSEKDTYYTGGEHSDTSPEIVNELLVEKLHLANFRLLEGIFPEETSHLIDDEIFCFCHIDVDVYNSAKDIVDWIWPRLKIGGIIVYDDYGNPFCSGITEILNEEIIKEDRIVLCNLNGHAIIVRVK